MINIVHEYCTVSSQLKLAATKFCNHGVGKVFPSSGTKFEAENFSSYPIYTNVRISSIFLVISWEHSHSSTLSMTVSNFKNKNKMVRFCQSNLLKKIKHFPVLLLSSKIVILKTLFAWTVFLLSLQMTNIAIILLHFAAIKFKCVQNYRGFAHSESCRSGRSQVTGSLVFCLGYLATVN